MDLSAVEIRVLGCLVEKEATTPDVYPLSTHALVAACNQRSSREPVVDYDESDVTATLIGLRERGLVHTGRGEGSRVYKHAHRLGEVLGLGEAPLSVLSVLMLRGPQTAGELRTRTERQHPFPSVEAVEESLAALAAHDPPLAARLERRPGQKEARWAHLLGGEAPGPRDDAATARTAGRSAASELEQLRAELAELRARVEALERPGG